MGVGVKEGVGGRGSGCRPSPPPRVYGRTLRGARAQVVLLHRPQLSYTCGLAASTGVAPTIFFVLRVFSLLLLPAARSALCTNTPSGGTAAALSSRGGGNADAGASRVSDSTPHSRM